MTRDLWNRFMIGLMGATIVVCAHKIVTLPDAAQDPRYWIGIGLGALVIVLKVREIKQSQEGVKRRQ
jgi:hypothetical protein